MSRAREFADLAGSADAGGISGSNIPHNGAMQVAQRGTVTGITSGTYAGPDRIKTQPSGLGTWTVEQSTDAPDGFSNSYKLTCTTADSSPAAGDYIQLRIPIEGQDVQHLDYGSSGALATTISFYVKSSKTGTFTYVLRTFDSGAGTRLFSKNVTISSANTWEYKTVTAPGDASGAINNDNTMGLDISFWLNSGSSFSGGSEQTTWANQSNNDKYLGNIDLGNATSETFQLTGIKLEIGEQGTPFEHEPFGVTLQKAMRYYEKSYDYATAPGTGIAYPGNLPLTIRGMDEETSGQRYFVDNLKVEKRAAPTNTYYDEQGNTGKVTTYDSAGTGTHNVSIGLVVTESSKYGAGPGNSAIWGFGFYYECDAEL